MCTPVYKLNICNIYIHIIIYIYTYSHRHIYIYIHVYIRISTSYRATRPTRHDLMQLLRREGANRHLGRGLCFSKWWQRECDIIFPLRACMYVFRNDSRENAIYFSQYVYVSMFLKIMVERNWLCCLRCVYMYVFQKDDWQRDFFASNWCMFLETIAERMIGFSNVSIYICFLQWWQTM